MDAGWVNPWVGFGWSKKTLGCVGFGFKKCSHVQLYAYRKSATYCDQRVCLAVYQLAYLANFIFKFYLNIL